MLFTVYLEFKFNWHPVFCLAILHLCQWTPEGSNAIILPSSCFSSGCRPAWSLHLFSLVCLPLKLLHALLSILIPLPRIPFSLSSPIFFYLKGYTSVRLQAWAEGQEVLGRYLRSWVLEQQGPGSPSQQQLTKEAAAWVLGGEGSRTLCTRSPLAEEWARSIANCCGRRKDMLLHAPTLHSLLQDQSTGTANREGISGARPQFRLDQRLEDSVLRGQQIMRNRDRERNQGERDTLREIRRVSETQTQE